MELVLFLWNMFYKIVPYSSCECDILALVKKAD